MGKIFITKKIFDLNNVSLLLPFDNNFQDFSSNNFAVTANGNVQISNAQSKFGGGSALFDGSGDYIEATVGAGEFGSGDFTIECWINANTTTSVDTVISKGILSTVDDRGWTLEWSGGRLAFFGYGEYSTGIVITNNVLNTGTWYHIAVVKQGSTFKMFLDGVQQTNHYGNPTTGTLNAGGQLFVGTGFFDLVNRSFHGYIDDLRITKGVARYTSNFTPPGPLFNIGKLNISKTVFPMTNLLAFWRLEGLTDSSGNGYTLTNNGNVQFVAGKIGNSALGNGENYLTAPVALNLSNQPYTFSFWINLESFNGNGAIVLIGKYPGFSLSVQGPDLLRLDDFTQSASYVSVGAVPLNTWTHLCVTKDASQNVQAYFNGQLDAGTGTTNTDNIANFTLFSAFTYHNYAGRLDALGVWSRVLTINEIKTLYNNGAGLEPFRNGKLNISKPVFPMANLLAFWKLNNTSDSSGNGYTLTNNGNVQFSAGKIGNCAVTDGSNYLSVPNFTINGSFSLSFWMKVTAGYGNYNIGVNQYPGLIVYPQAPFDGSVNFGDFATWAVTSAPGVIQSDIFHHYCLVTNNTSTTLYIDGVSVSSSNVNLCSMANPQRVFGIFGNNVDGTYGGNSKGSMDALGLWSRALTINEVKTLYNNGEGLEP
jgi:hypothetical protein